MFRYTEPCSNRCSVIRFCTQTRLRSSECGLLHGNKHNIHREHAPNGGPIAGQRLNDACGASAWPGALTTWATNLFSVHSAVTCAILLLRLSLRLCCAVPLVLHLP